MERGTAGTARRNGARSTYEAMAPVYDDFTAEYDYDGWMEDLLELLKRHALEGSRLLDVACGTGKSFLPMLRRGWEVTGCDLSVAMLERAAYKVGASAELSIADMRDLPRFGDFDLVWALDDAINYLLSVNELRDCLRGMRENLAPKGLLVFDVNELLVYQTFYAETSIRESGALRFVWHGLSSGEASPGTMYESRLEVQQAATCEEAADLPADSVHRQRHFPESEIRDALDRVGLKCLDVFGHGLDGIPRQPLDPSTHTKAIYIARRA